MKYNPRRDKVFIEADKPKEQTASGFLIAEDWKNQPPFGTVLAVGPDVEELEPGDRVMFGRFQAQISEGQLRIVQERYVWAKVTNE